MAKSHKTIIISLLLVSVLLLFGCAQQSQANQKTDGSVATGNDSMSAGDSMPAGDSMAVGNSMQGEDSMHASDVKSFDMIAKQFEFVPGTITVKKGDTVKLTITSTDVEHGITIPEFGVNQTIPAGQTATVEFVASKAGTFEFHCNVFCGEGHGEMKGKLVVEE